jgi:Mn2+/Fe2+ NRAMP family transporter
MGRFGPGLLVTAAFVGPGTVTTASLAGAEYGLGLLWALLFSLATTLVLQEMAARVGLVTRRGLAEALRETITAPGLRAAVLALVIAAVGVGNAAYQAGNLVGAAAGATLVTGLPAPVLAAGCAALAALLLATGRYALVERGLVGLVVLMSLLFLVTALLRPPSAAFLLPVLPTGDAALTTLALVGTTVVPYNLFLHASAVRDHWPEAVPLPRALAEARLDTTVSVSLGGVVTLAIMSTAATAWFGRGVSLSPSDLAEQLGPLVGEAARVCFALGLLAAGLTSAVTAPLAAAWAVAGACGWPPRLDDVRFRAVWAAVLAAGTAFAVTDAQPLATILFAQAANGLLLPVVAIALLWVANREDLLGPHRNGLTSNVAGVAVIAVTLLLGGRRLLTLVGG